ncbi:MAG: glycosyltransferase family 4 protein [Candidatus Paceibacterota bacterium]|jgi:glycosyltransferase involved in cell wall biosynthesis
MRIFNFSLDQSLFNSQSIAARRVADYGQMAERYLLLVPNRHDVRHELGAGVEVIGVGGWSKEIVWWRAWIKAGKILANNQFDLISVQDIYFLALIAWRVAKKYQLPLEIQVHGFERFGGVREKIARFLLPRADGVRVVSQRLKQTLIEDFKVNPNKISVVPIFSEFNCGLSKELIEKPEGCFVFLTAARLVKVKRIETQLDALVEIKQKHPNARLWIVGDGPERRHLEWLVATLDLQTEVKFWGRYDDLSPFYRSADAFVLSSESEGWGITVIEAGTCGLPVVMTDVGCAGEIVVNNESGLVVPVGDRGALTGAMRLLLEDKNLRQSLSENLKNAVAKMPTKAETMELYKQGWEKMTLRSRNF